MRDMRSNTYFILAEKTDWENSIIMTIVTNLLKNKFGVDFLKKMVTIVNMLALK